MPITQSRFIGLINASADIIDATRALRAMTAPSYASAIINANAALAQAPPGPLADAVRELMEYVQRVDSAISEANILASDHAIAIQTEREWFRRNAKRNEKAALSQRKARVREAVANDKPPRPRLWQQGFVHKGLSTDSNPASLEQELRARNEMGTQAQDIENNPILKRHHDRLIANWPTPETTVQTERKEIWTKK